MIKNKFLALAMAAAMTLATAVPAFADNETTVSLTVPEWNTYTLTVPADTELNIDGTAKQLSGGIKITGGNLMEGKKLTVTAESAHEWKMTASGVETKISYSLYSNSNAATSATTWEFTRDEANAESGTTKDVYAKANTDEMYEAASGVYSDVITFTAKVESAAPQVTFTLDISGGNYQSYSVDEGTTWRDFIEKNNISLGRNSIINNNGYGTMDLNSAIVSGRYFLGEAQVVG